MMLRETSCAVSPSEASTDEHRIELAKWKVAQRKLRKDEEGAAIGSVSTTELAASVIAASETESQEDIKNLFTSSSLNAIPVIDSDGRMKGIVTLDDIVDVGEQQLHTLIDDDSLLVASLVAAYEIKAQTDDAE